MYQVTNCHRCLRRNSCELFDAVCRHTVEYCRDFIEEEDKAPIYTAEHFEWRRDWWENMEDEFGEYSPDDFEW